MKSQNSAIVNIEDIKSLIRIIRKNWLIALLCVLAAYFVSVAYIYKLTDIYGAQTQILLKGDNVYDDRSVIGQGGFNWSGYKTYVDNSNQTQVLTSYDLIEESIDKMNLEVSYFIVGRIRTTEVYDAIPFKVTPVSINRDLYEQQIDIRILSEEDYEVSYVKGKENAKIKCKFNVECIEPDFVIKIEKTNAFNPLLINELKNIQYQFQIHSKQNLVRQFREALKVENPDYTNILKISFEDRSSERAVMFLDTLAQVYIDNSLDSKYELNRNTIFYIDKQLGEITEILSSIEDTLEDYKERESIFNLTREEEEYFSKLSAFDAQITSCNLQIMTLNDLEKYVVENKDPNLLPPSTYLIKNDNFLTSSVSDLYDLQLSKYKRMSVATDEIHSIQEADKTISMMKRDLLIYINNLRTSLKEQIVNVEREVKNYENNLRYIPKKQRDLLNIQRKLQVNEKMYMFLLEKRATTVIARASIIPESKIIEKARSVGVVKPDKNRITGVFVTIGFAIGLFIALVRTLFFEKIESIDELKSKTNLPILGEIVQAPKVDKDNLLEVDINPKSMVTESFRTIRTNLQYFASASESKVILITSNKPGEGKTFCSINLSSILAKAGKKVLLLELDLHKPKVGLGLGMTSNIGMSNYLIGKASISDIILKTPVENLDVILSGPLPPNASELILSDNLLKLLEQAKSTYDYVMIDTPPVGLITDAVYLMKHSDVSLFVVNAKLFNKDSLILVNEMVRANQIGNLALLLNGVKRRNSKSYYNRYSYGYGYGYGYVNKGSKSVEK